MAGSEHWESFKRINEERRSVRDFTGEPLEDADVQAILGAAQLAPSSNNTQPYEFHWVRSPEARARVAEACNGQRAARSASALVVVVARWRQAPATYAQLLAHVEGSPQYDENARTYYRDQARKVSWGMRIMGLRLMGALRILLSTLFPRLMLVPLGPAGASHWAVRSSIFAAQTLLLAASARGLASCPMEGFNPLKVAEALGLDQGAVIPLVIALGRPASDARIDPRWRRPLEETVFVH